MALQQFVGLRMVRSYVSDIREVPHHVVVFQECKNQKSRHDESYLNHEGYLVNLDYYSAGSGREEEDIKNIINNRERSS